MAKTTTNQRADVFRRNMRRLLKREWLSQREAADEIGVSYKWMRRLCHQGLERIDSRTESKMEKVADWFGMRVSDLWREETGQRLEPSRGQALVKWTGSKRLQADEIVSRFPSKIGTYFEPFIGGGSVLYRLLESQIPVARYRCSDTCVPLIRLWRLVKDDPRQIVEEYRERWEHLRNEGASYYYEVRDEFNETGDPSLFFFVLRTCRNGLVRFNQSGAFTAGFHHGRKGMRPERVKGIVEDWARKLQEHDVRFYFRDYRRIRSERGDLLYLDPPYAVAGRLRLYSQRIDFGQFFRWLRKQSGAYLLSLDGFVENEDRTVEVPDDLYDEHVFVGAGHASLPRINGSGNSAVTDSLYVRRGQ